MLVWAIERNSGRVVSSNPPDLHLGAVVFLTLHCPGMSLYFTWYGCLLEFRGCANHERRNGIGRNPVQTCKGPRLVGIYVGNSYLIVECNKLSHAKCEGLQQRPKCSDIVEMLAVDKFAYLRVNIIVVISHARLRLYIIYTPLSSNFFVTGAS